MTVVMETGPIMLALLRGGGLQQGQKRKVSCEELLVKRDWGKDSQVKENKSECYVHHPFRQVKNKGIFSRNL